MNDRMARKIIEASLVTPISIAIPGFALLYSKMWKSLLAFVILLLPVGYLIYLSIGKKAEIMLATFLLISIHFMFLAYIVVAKAKGSQ
ncbi:hypothetical protein [Halomonas sp. DQ26W]|uniref:hypothetical protein n=1 Tax=Halomonas sp. DQ26W TaxID=2282311 RepID=UPI0011C029AB|nr:hypothetical protein [Halomonas sp. DQ26W]